MYDIAICDDSAQDRSTLKDDIMKCEIYSEHIRFHEYCSGKELLSAIGIAHFSIIFLDIQMRDLDGQKTAEEIRKRDDSVILVFYTGYAEPTPQSFEVQPYRFIKKNMSFAQRSRNIRAAMERMVEMNLSPVLEAKHDKMRLYLKPDDIVYIEKYRKGARVHLSLFAMQKHHLDITKKEGTEIRITNKLNSLYEVLRPHGFGYPHDSYIINFKYLASCKKEELRLQGFPDTVFKITRSKSVEFNQLKKEFLTSKYGEH